MWHMHLQSLKLYAQQFRSRCIYKKIQYLTLTVKVARDVAKRLYIMWPMHTECAEFEIATSNGLGVAFKRKYIIWFLTLKSMSYEILPSTFDIMWPMLLQSLKLLPVTFYKTWTWRTDAHTGVQADDFETKLIYPFIKRRKSGYDEPFKVLSGHCSCFSLLAATFVVCDNLWKQCGPKIRTDIMIQTITPWRVSGRLFLKKLISIMEKYPVCKELILISNRAFATGRNNGWNKVGIVK